MSKKPIKTDLPDLATALKLAYKDNAPFVFYNEAGVETVVPPDKAQAYLASLAEKRDPGGKRGRSFVFGFIFVLLVLVIIFGYWTYQDVVTPFVDSIMIRGAK